MKAIYFPFTYISDYTAKAVYTFFKQFSVILPSEQNVPEGMKTLAADKLINIVIPVKDDATKIDSALKEFRTWGNFHASEKSPLVKTMTDAIPFFSETSISQIRADVKKTAGAKKSKKNDSLFAARLFLHFAQDFDAQQVEIASQLDTFEQREKAIFRNLKEMDDGDNIPVKKFTKKDDYGNYMPKERVSAWSRLFAHTSGDSAFFVTNSRSILEFVMEKYPQMVKIVSTGPILKDTADKFENYLKELAENSWDLQKKIPEKIFTAREQGVSSHLTLYIIPDTDPREIFPGHFNSEKRKIKNTLMGFVQNGC